MTAKTVVRVVTEARQGWLTMADLRTFVRVWDALREFELHRHPAGVTDAVEPTVMIEGQAGRVSKIQADLPDPA